MSNASARNARYANIAALAVFAYLALVNLDWALLWDDEATLAFLARNWVKLGAPLVDDMRNIFSFRIRAGADIAADGTFHYPQLPIAIQALVFAVFGVGDVQVRAVSAAFSLAAMALFALVLRHEFPQRPGLRAVALVLACLSPMTLGYARAGTYNGTLLFFHMLLFWSYLQFCARRHIGYAALAVVAALAAFHAHYLSSMVFLAAIGLFHILFRYHHFDRRSWLISIAAIGIYTAQVLWYYFTEYSFAAYGYHANILSQISMMRVISQPLALLNRNGILTWSVALWGVAWCGAVWWRAQRDQANAGTRRHKVARRGNKPRDNARHDATPSDNGWRALREERVLHYLVLTITGAVVLTLAALCINLGPDVRYVSTFAPFAAIIAAAMVCWAWRVARSMGIALGAALLLSNITGWPFLQSIEHGNKPAWTLPALVAEYHRDYPDSMRESLAYIRAHVQQDALFYTNYNNLGWMLWYLSDKVLFCCVLSREVKQSDALHTEGRAYLFRQDVFSNVANTASALVPEYLFVVDIYDVRETLTLIDDGPIYHRIADFPGAVTGVGPLVRPEPPWHASRPDRMRHSKANIMYLYRLEQP